MREHFPNLEREKTTQVQEAQRLPINMNPKNPTPRHIIIKISSFKDKERILKKSSKGETRSNIQGAPIRLAAGFSTETLQARRE